MADEMQVTLPEGVLRPIIQAQVIGALQGQERLITEFVKLVMETRVRENYSSRDKTLVESVCHKVLCEAIEATVRDWVAEQAPAIKAEVQRQLSTKRKSIAESLVQTMIDGANDRWRLTVSASIGER